MREVIIYPCLRYLLLVPKSYITGPKFGHRCVVHIVLAWVEFVIPSGILRRNLSTLSTTIIHILVISRPYVTQYAQRSTIAMVKLQPDWMFSLICVWINGWVNNREAGDLRRHRGHYDVNVMWISNCINCKQWVVIIHPCPNYNGCLVKPPLNLEHRWVSIFHMKPLVKLVIHVQVSMWGLKHHILNMLSATQSALYWGINIQC